MRNLSKAAIAVAAVAAVLPATAGAAAPQLAVTAQTTGVAEPGMRDMALTLTCTISGAVQHAVIDECFTSNGLDAINASGVGPAGTAAAAGIVRFAGYTTCVSGSGINLQGKWIHTGRQCQTSIANLTSIAVATA